MEAPCCARCIDDGDVESRPLGDTLADSGSSPFECAVREELHGRVESCLRRVPEAFRTVVVLREIEGFTYEEIAEILQVNLGTVKSRLMRGRSALRELLTPEKDTNAGADARCDARTHSSVGQQNLFSNGSRPRARAGSALGSNPGPRLEASR